MIVKDEAHVIERCISSIRPVIDAWSIIDTGSTDGTQDRIRELLGDLPGGLVESPWVDFAHNRSESLDRAAAFGDYALVIDADVRCIVPASFDRDRFARSLTDDYYLVMIKDAIHYQRPMLTSTHLPFSYRGALHEFVDVPPGATCGGIIEDFHYESEFDGARSQNRFKGVDDAATLVRALEAGDDPDLTPRYLFYLANSFRDAGELDAALDAYRARVEAGGWSEEVFVSWLNIGRIHMFRGDPSEVVIDAFLRAADALPVRAESLCEGARCARLAGRFATAHLLASRAIAIERPRDSLFLEPDVYDWRSLYEFSIAAWHVGDFGPGLRACHRLLHEDRLPPAERQAVEGNLEVYPAEAITW